MIAISAFTVSVCRAQAGGTPSPSPLESRINKLEEQISSLDKKIQKPPKDYWDIVGILSGFFSGLIVAAIGGLVTYLYQRREGALRLAQSQKENEDRTAKLRLEDLENQRAATQLEIEKTNKEREIAISQAQTVRELLPSLQSTDQKIKQAALTLIAVLGNSQLAVQLSSLFETDFVPTLQGIASMPSAKPEARIQAAVALGHLGEDEKAATALVDLSNDTNFALTDRLSIADELERLKKTEKAAEVQLQVALDPNAGAEVQDRVLTALTRLNYIEKAREQLSQIGHDGRAEVSQRVAAIEMHSKLRDPQAGLDEWIPVLLEMLRASKTPLELNELAEAFKRLGHSDKSADLLWEIGSDLNAEITRRYAAANKLVEFGLEKYTQLAAEERKKILREVVQNPQGDPGLRLIAVREGLGAESKEENAIILREILESPQIGTFGRLNAIRLLAQMGYIEEAKQKGEEVIGKNFLARLMFGGFLKKLESSKTDSTAPPRTS